jgi:tetratricopeptide (TPR) repeat protein
MAGREREAVEAATFIVGQDEHSGVLLRERAEALLRRQGALPSESRPSSPDSETGEASSEYASIRRLIRPLRKRVKADPHDALAWLEMGRLHATVGNAERALRAVRVAHSLAEDSRFVLRSASRFFLHSGDPETAHEILRRSARTKVDPWLSAAEIATAQVANVSPRSIRTSKDLLSSGRFSDHDLSELRAALATDALLDRKRKDAKRLLESSLRLPTENAVAQALWIAQSAEFGDLASVLQVSLSTPRSFEARSHASYNAGIWDEALKEARRWCDDEPFSGRAAVHASVIASVAFEKHDEAIAMLRAALRASPGNFIITTNLVYNLAQSGHLVEASELLRETRHFAEEPANRVVILANLGLVAMRSGQLESGRKAYTEAIQFAKDRGFRELEEQAKLYFVAEELSLRNKEELPKAKELVAESELSKSPEARLVVARIRREIERLTSE